MSKAKHQQLASVARKSPTGGGTKKKKASETQENKIKILEDYAMKGIAITNLLANNIKFVNASN